MTNKRNMQELFIKELYLKIPEKRILTNFICDVLNLEKDCVYRRLSQKVYFTFDEISILCHKLRISLDHIVFKDDISVNFPTILQSPFDYDSIDNLIEYLKKHFKKISDISSSSHSEAGNVYSTFPLEIYMYSPLITKFMLFKWGNYFISSEEFKSFSEWEPPRDCLINIMDYKKTYLYDKIFYILDHSVIYSLVNEIEYLVLLQVLTVKDKTEILNEIKQLLIAAESAFNGTSEALFKMDKDIFIYISPVNLGFNVQYFGSINKYYTLLSTYFSFSAVEIEETYNKTKKWVDSIRNISSPIFPSGRVERKIFFNTQYKIIESGL